MKRQTSEERIILCQNLHNNQYDYSKTDFTNVKSKTVVICPIHGEFETTFDRHFHGHNGCKYCSKPVRDLKSFIVKAKQIHGDIYDYSKFVYKNSHTKSIIICPIHGEFEQIPNAHLRGQGCPKCGQGINKLEVQIKNILTNLHVEFQEQKRFDWLNPLSLDFYLPQYNIAIECQGKQHFGVGGWTKNFDFKKQKERDKRKFKLCEQNDIQIVYFTDVKGINEYFGKIFSDNSSFIDYIRYLLLK